jgi:Flp pilus assembly pilin Flp
MFLNLLRKLWSDDCGAVLAVEWTIMAGVASMGTLAGAVAVRDAVNANMHEAANVIRVMSPAANFSGWSTQSASVPGYQFSPPVQQPQQPAAVAPNVIVIQINNQPPAP